MNYKQAEEKIAKLEKQVKEMEREAVIAEAKEDGVDLVISETNPGRFIISRDYEKDSKANKKLLRLTR